MKIFIYLISFYLIFPASLQAMELPMGHILKQNDKGEYYVINSGKVVMIEPSIISIGYNKNWILTCIYNVSIDSDLKRMIFINLKNGGASDTINQKNWEGFKSIYQELETITLEKLQDDSCP